MVAALLLVASRVAAVDYTPTVQVTGGPSHIWVHPPGNHYPSGTEITFPEGTVVLVWAEEQNVAFIGFAFVNVGSPEGIATRGGDTAVVAINGVGPRGLRRHASLHAITSLGPVGSFLDVLDVQCFGERRCSRVPPAEVDRVPGSVAGATRGDR